ncbi:MAG: hypothetical protein V4565_05960 [Bacteroidota bacterium]
MENLENKNLTLELVDGILIAHYLCENIDLEIAKSIVHYRLQRFGYKDFPALIHAGNVKQVTKDARKYFATDESCQKINVCAIIAKSTLTTIIVNFILQIHKPPIHTKLFTDEKTANEWLLKNKLINV